jgi:hypothetical protein
MSSLFSHKIAIQGIGEICGVALCNDAVTTSSTIGCGALRVHLTTSCIPRDIIERCHLESWNTRSDPEQFQRDTEELLERHPWTEEEILANFKSDPAYDSSTE